MKEQVQEYQSTSRRAMTGSLALAALGLLFWGSVAGDALNDSSHVGAGAGVFFGQEGASASGGIVSWGSGGAEGSEGPSRMIGGEDAPQLCDGGDELSVLFIGNSYTHYFDMPRIFAGMAESAGCAVDAHAVAPGGSRLKLHADSGETLNAIGSRSWDVVVLQNFSQLPSQPLSAVQDETLPFVQALTDAVRQNNPETQLVYYVTWGRRDGDEDYCAHHSQVCTFRGHTAALYRGYRLYSEVTGGVLSDVGGAFAEVHRDRKRPLAFSSLYDEDGSHPSLAGSTLAAAVFFSTIFQRSPQDLAYPQGLSEKTARYLQSVAARLPTDGA